MLAKLKSDLILAMKAKDTVKVTAIRRIVAEIQTIEATTGKAVADLNCINIIKKLIKQNEEEIATRTGIEKYVDIIEVLKKEIVVMQDYLPIFLSKEKIKEILSLPNNLSHIKQAKNSGAAIGISMKLLKEHGATEGATVKETTEEIYNG